MATSYTSLLGLALPVTGELSGTWGDTVNTSITALLDTSIAGTTNVSTDADVTLTTTTGAANTARQAILLFSGARTVLRTVTAPAQSKIYTVINATTGGFAVKLVGAGPTTGLTIPNGASATVAWNGSDFIEVGTASIGNLTVNGTLTVTGATTLQSTLAVTGAITNTAGTANGVTYLNGSKVLTSGSALVFDGTNLGLGVTPSAWTLAPAFELKQSGVGFWNSGSNDLYHSNNAYYNSGWKYGTSSVAVTQYRQNAGAHSWYTAPSGTAGNAITFTQAMTLDNSGNLGIGTSSPTNKLTVQANDVFNQDSSGQIVIKGSSNTAKNLRIGFDTTSDYGYIQAIETGVADRPLVLQPFAGNLGIGTSSPAAKLDVNGNAQIGNATAATNRSLLINGVVSKASRVVFQESGVDRWLIGNGAASENGNFEIYDATNGNNLVMTRSGILGLGVTPATWTTYKAISIAGTGQGVAASSSGESHLLANAYYNSGWKYAATQGAARFSIGEGFNDFRFYTAASGTAGNAITFTQAMTLDASGNLGIGMTPTNFGNGYTVLQVANATNGGMLYLTNTSNAGGRIYGNAAGITYDAFSTTYHAFNTDGSERARIDSSGNLLVGTTSNLGRVSIVPTTSQYGIVINAPSSSGTYFLQAYQAAGTTVGSISSTNGTNTIYATSSDYRLKNITGALTGYKERIMSLQPKQGTWKVDGSEFRGFLAHEFAQPYSVSVSGEKDAVDADGKPIMQGMQASSSEVMADLVALVKELVTENASLKARLDAANL